MYKNILVEMERNGFTDKMLSEKLNLSVKTLRKKIMGESDFRINEVEKLLSLFGKELTFKYLFNVYNA